MTHETPLILAHLSDIHFFSGHLDISDLFSKSLLGICNHYIRRRPKEKKLLETLPSFLKTQKVTHVIISGDLTTTSNPKEYLSAQEFILSLQKEGFDVLAIPGNHDHYTKKAYLSRRFYRYIPSLPSLREKGVAYREWGEGFGLIALDTSIATSPISSEGLFSEKIEKNLSDLLQSLPTNKPLLLVNHFPIHKGNCPKRHRMIRFEALRSLLEKYPNVRLYLYGHTHQASILPGPPFLLNGGSPTQGENGSFHILDLQKDSVGIRLFSRQDRQWQETKRTTLDLSKDTINVNPAHTL